MFDRRAVAVPAVQVLALALLTAALPAASAAQWVPTAGPRGGSVGALLTVPDGHGGVRLYAGESGVWRSGDRGASWAHTSSGLPSPGAFTLLAVPDGAGGDAILVGTAAGVFRSADHGASFSPSSAGLPADLSIYELAAGSNGAGGSYVYAGTYLGRMFRSADHGASWTEVSTGLPVGQAHVTAVLAAPSGTVLAGTGNGLYRSTSFGASWTRVHTLPGLSLARHGATLYAGTTNGVYRSTNDGASWTAINNGMAYNWVHALAAVPAGSGVILFANFMRSLDDGATWTWVGQGLTSPSASGFATAANASGGTDLFAGTPRGVLRTSDHGATWTDVGFVSSRVQAVEVTPSGAVLAGSENDIFRTVDGGASWTDTRSSTTALDFAVNRHSPAGTSVFAGHSPAGIYKSTNDGVTWAASGNGLDDLDVNSIGAIPNGTGGTRLLAGTASRLFISTDDGGWWAPANLEALILDYAVTPNGAGGHEVWAAGYGGVWLSTNHGTAWTARSGGLAGSVIQGIAATGNGAHLFAGGDPFGVQRSSDRGLTWSPANHGIADPRIFTVMSPDGNHVFAAGAGGVYVSADHGASWSAVGAGLTAPVFQLAVSADGATLYAGTGGFGVWKRPLAEMIAAPPPPPPPPAPVIASFSPASGAAGTAVTLSGSHFTSASAVTFNLVTAAFTVVSASEIQATVPAGATTGRIRVTTPAGTATSAADFTVAAPPPPVTLTFAPPHDAYVRSSSASSNFGSRAELGVRSGSTTLRSYLKFTVTGVQGAVQAARLRLRVTDAGPDGGFVHSVANTYKSSATPWTESGLTWNNAPPLGANHGYLGTATSGTWREVDVTGAITGNGTFSFAVSGGSSNQVDYSSSEGAFPPQLVVIASGAAVARVTIVPEAAVPAEAGIAVAPVALALHAGPNPLSAATTIRYALPRSGPVRLAVYDVAGRMVRTLVHGQEPAGERQVRWDRRDAGGAPVPAGLYLCRLEAGGTALTRKLNVAR